MCNVCYWNNNLLSYLLTIAYLGPIHGQPSTRHIGIGPNSVWNEFSLPTAWDKSYIASQYMIVNAARDHTGAEQFNKQFNKTHLARSGWVWIPWDTSALHRNCVPPSPHPPSNGALQLQMILLSDPR